jgi:hypothetical protein
MEIISLFAGERRRSIDVTTIEEIQEASRELAMGDGWGQRVEGSVEELRRVGAREGREGGWTVRTAAGELCAEVVS